MRRVAIIGSPGAGKTTFAGKLADKTGLPLIHLDMYYHDPDKNYYEDQKAWSKRVERLASKDKWIIDGNNHTTYEQRFKRADTIIFLDFSRWTSLTGVIRRRIRHHRKPRHDMPSGWKEKLRVETLGYIWRFRENSSSTIMRFLSENKHAEILIFKTRRDADEYLKIF